MQLALEAPDLAALSQPQKDAILSALFIALIADGEPSAEELAQFEHAVAALPWGRDRGQLQLLTRATVARLGEAGDAGKAAFLRELAETIPGAALREKVVLDMAAIVAADQVASIAERTVIGVFAQSFGLDLQQTLAKIKARLPEADRAAELGVKLEPDDVAALDDAAQLAIIETLVAGVLADGKATPIELRWFETVVANLPWHSPPPVLQAQIQGISQRINTVKTPAEFSDFIVNIAARLPSQALREKVFYTLATIMFADGDVNNLEKNTLGAFVFAFGITSDRLAAIKAAVTGRTTPPPASTAS